MISPFGSPALIEPAARQTSFTLTAGSAHGRGERLGWPDGGISLRLT